MKIILSACTTQEEDIWKQQLRERIVYETHDFAEGHSAMQDMFSSLFLDIKSLGPVFGHANSLVRRMSVHRAATLGAKTNMSQVIIKNTQAQKSPDSSLAFSPGMVTRSQSHMSSNHVPTLAPRRADRNRLENILEDVWTKDTIPFPGMSTRKVEHQIRASANSVMRKLSMASIASNFSRRSPSFSSVSNTRSEDSFGSRFQKQSQVESKSRPTTDRRLAPAVVDFHNAPAAFLPADFGLQDHRPTSRRRRLVSRTVGVECQLNEKTHQPRTTRVRRLSTHIINIPRSGSSVHVAERSTSHGSHSAAMRTSEPWLDIVQSTELGARKKKDETITASKDESLGKLLSNKFPKTKSRILKFWA